MMLALMLAASAALYAWGWCASRARHRPFPALRAGAFAPGSLVVAAALLGPLDALADASLSWHMAQHLALITLAAPLLLLGAPMRLALAALPGREATIWPAFSTARRCASSITRSSAWPAYGRPVRHALLAALRTRARERDGARGEHVLYLTSPD
jgi:cytochrome c oxidase assembly factor CtaG